MPVADINALGIKNQDEIGVLYNSLKRAEGHLQAYLKSIREKIDLEKNLAASEAASEAKSTFLSSMSHEIRSPINAVLGLDEMIIRESHESEIKSYATDIQSSGKMLLSIINDILDFSKIEAGKMEIIPVDYDMSSVISDLVNMIDERAKKKGLTFTVNIDETMPHLLHGDDTRLKQCILNILTNAVKYTAKGSVKLAISSEQLAIENGKLKMENKEGKAFPYAPTPLVATPSTGDTPVTPPNTVLLKVSVKDTGIGIKAEDINKLFSPFERIEEGRNRAIEGTGLGMSIVKNLLAAMGTHLDVQSVYGEGSDFSFSVVQEVRSWEPIGNYEETKKKSQAETASYTESFHAPEAKILVVDDTPINLTVMKGLLKETQIQITTAESGFDALEKAKTEPFDVIFIDHMMPKMDGIEMIKNLRADDSSVNQHTICVALTANVMGGVKEQYLSADFEDYLAKPIEPKLLEEMLVKYLPTNKVQLAVSREQGTVGSEQSESRNLAYHDLGDSDIRQNDTPRHAELVSASLFKTIFDIDIASALRNCGTEEVFLEAVKNFRESIEEKSNLIEEYAKSEDWKNYTILVHALKSSARLIGATDLSEKAKELEAAGDEILRAAQNDNNVSLSGTTRQSIAEKTPALLSEYRAYFTKLAPLTGDFGIHQDDTTRHAERSEASQITPDQVTDALSALREVVSVFDFDSADSIIKELDSYEMPADFAEKYQKIRKAVRDVDQNAVMELLK